MNRRVLQAAQTFSKRLTGQGAEAVVLCGSWVRNDAYKESDLDIHAVGRGPHHRLERFRGFLISASWATARQVRSDFKNPGLVGGVIPAWRNAVIIYDPHGIANTLEQEAERWRWDSLGKRARLAIHMAPILAVHQRILCETENQLWDLVSERMGADWAQLQSASLGEGGQSLEESCRASLDLYISTARGVRHLLNQQQCEVVAHACEIAGESLGGKE